VRHVHHGEVVVHEAVHEAGERHGDEDELSVTAGRATAIQSPLRDSADQSEKSLCEAQDEREDEGEYAEFRCHDDFLADYPVARCGRTGVSAWLVRLWRRSAGAAPAAPASALRFNDARPPEACIFIVLGEHLVGDKGAVRPASMRDDPLAFANRSGSTPVYSTGI